MFVWIPIPATTSSTSVIFISFWTTAATISTPAWHFLNLDILKNVLSNKF